MLAVQEENALLREYLADLGEEALLNSSKDYCRLASLQANKIEYSQDCWSIIDTFDQLLGLEK